VHKQVQSKMLESDHLNLVIELKSMMVTGSEFQAFVTRSLKKFALVCCLGVRFLQKNSFIGTSAIPNIIFSRILN